ncbi:MAG: dihydrolipoamide dehydrogenase [Rhizobiales bacterium]|nr:dihydrolipoamide dehydrogenase [Hyphomicrobiales bacterium]
MGELLRPDLCVIGGGAGGLSVAAAASQLGTSVVLIERGMMGGDCLYRGCVPSKALLAAGKRAQLMRSQGTRAFGISPTSPVINHAAVRDHVWNVISTIEPNDSVERFTGLGVKVIQESGRFKDASTVVAGPYEIKARRFVVATGSSPFVPPIPGLDKVTYFTNESIFENGEKLEHLIVIGGGPIGLEMAQAHHRLGSRVTVLEGAKALAKDDPELTQPVLRALRDEGITIEEGVRVEGVEPGGKGGVRVAVSRGTEQGVVEGSHLLVATGRQPNVEGLALEAAGIRFDRRGIKVGANLKTSNSKVWAIGDVTGGLQFTHVANYHAGIVVRQALFRLPVKVNNDIVPWVTFTDPELAHVGLSEDEATKRRLKFGVLRWPYHENDRAQAERITGGMVKVVVGRGGRILGATIMGDKAGELIQMWALAISSGLKIKAMTAFISPYPTLSEVNKRVAYTYFLPSLANPLVRRAVAFLRRFG